MGVPWAIGRRQLTGQRSQDQTPRRPSRRRRAGSRKRVML